MFLVFIQSPVHVRNWSMIEPAAGRGCVVAEKRLKLHACAQELLNAHPVRRVDSEEVPGLFEQDVEAVVFFAMHPREVPLALLAEAEARNIAVIAIEESNQLALNEGRVNNYLLPAHHIFAASAAEADAMVAQGVERDKIEVSGWGFHEGRETVPGPGEKKEARQRLGLRGGPVAAFLPIGFNVRGENLSKRRWQLRQCRTLARAGWTVVAKPHPAEPNDFFQHQVRKAAPEVVVLGAEVPVEEVLVAADVVPGRGISQTALQALLLETPVLKLEMGDVTPFDDLPKCFKIGRGSSVVHCARAALRTERYAVAVCGVRGRHLPTLPSRARERLRQALSGRFASRPWTRGERECLALFCQWKCPALLPRHPRLDIVSPAQGLSSVFYDRVQDAFWLQRVELGTADPDPARLMALADTFPGMVHPGMFLDDLRRLVKMLEEGGHGQTLRRLKQRLQHELSDEYGLDAILQGLEERNPLRFVWNPFKPKGKNI